MKKTVATGLMTGLGALGAAAVTDTATAKTDSYTSCYGDDHSISRSSDYYWRRWQLQQPNRFLKRWLLLQQWLGRLIETRHQSVRRAPAGRSLGAGAGAIGLCLAGQRGDDARHAHTRQRRQFPAVLPGPAAAAEPGRGNTMTGEVTISAAAWDAV
jgi:hypothetical protein